MTETTTQLVERLRGFESDHEPHGWPAIKMADISALCGHITRLQCEAKVLRDLLAMALDVVKTCEGETAPECEALMDLQNQIAAALRGGA